MEVILNMEIISLFILKIVMRQKIYKKYFEIKNNKLPLMNIRIRYILKPTK